MAAIATHNWIARAIDYGHELERKAPIDRAVLVNSNPQLNPIWAEFHDEFVGIPRHRRAPTQIRYHLFNRCSSPTLANSQSAYPSPLRGTLPFPDTRSCLHAAITGGASQEGP